MSKRITKPISIIPFWIHNLEDFLPDEDYPVLHPKSKAYADYWLKQSENCMYGIWGNDSVIKDNKKVGGYRWLTNKGAFYTHHTVIEMEVEGQKAKGTKRPKQRDVEWLMEYDSATCDGFSGYSDDKLCTAFRPIGKMERGEKLTHSDKYRIDELGDQLRDKYGKFKKYVDARVMLYNTYDEPLGKPLWANECQNHLLLSTRRLGKSSWTVNGEVEYEFTFNGARTIDELYGHKTTSTVVVGSGNSDKTKEFFAKFNKSYDYLRSDVGSYNDGRVSASGFWWWKTEGSVLKENSFLTNQIKVEGRGAGLTGPGSRLWHVTYGKSASKGAGTSTNLSVIEEIGLTPDVEDIWAENAPTQKSNFKFGKSVGIGTGGDFELIECSKKMAYNPLAYDILPCKNYFVPGGKDTCRFVPATYYQDQFRNENGMQDILKAFEDIMYERDIKERLDTRQYLRHKASYPLTLEEIFVRFDGNEFPVKNLEERQAALKNGAVDTSIGMLAFTDSRNTDAYWIEDFDLVPLLEMEDLTDDNVNKEGAILQYEPPNLDKPIRKYNDRNPMYLVGAEPVRNDKGSSYYYTYVWKFFDYANPERMQNNIVMEYFGRLNETDKNLKISFAMAAYYGCNIYAEVNNDRIKGLARLMKKFEWLQPDLKYSDGLEVNVKKENDVGAYISPGQNYGLEKLTNEWLRQVVSYTEKIKASGYTREDVILADTLNSQMLCNQLIAYDRDGNFDAYDGIRLMALWCKANEKAEDQYIDTDKDKKLLDTMRKMMKTGHYQRN